MLTMCVVRDNACWYYHFTLHIQLSGALLPIVGLHHRPLSHIIHCVMLWGEGAARGGGTMHYLIFTLYYALFNYSDCAGTKLWMDLSSALCQNLITRPRSRHGEDVLWNTIFGDGCCCFKNLHISKRSLLTRWLNKLPQSQNWNSFSPNLHIAQWSNAFTKRVQ